MLWVFDWPQIDGIRTSQKTLYSCLRRKNISRQASPFATLHYSTLCCHTLYPLLLSLAHSAIVLCIPKCGATFQNCRPIAITVNTVQTNRVVSASLRGSTVFFRDCSLFSTRFVSKQASSHIGFTDYKCFTRATTANPFPLSCDISCDTRSHTCICTQMRCAFPRIKNRKRTPRCSAFATSIDVHFVYKYYFLPYRNGKRAISAVASRRDAEKAEN